MPVSKHSFFWSEENVNLNYFPTQDDVSVGVSCNFMDTKLYCCYIVWQMLCHVLWHVTCLGRWYCHVVCGRYYSHQADGIACVRLMTHIARIRSIFDVANSQRYRAGFTPMLFQWSHAHIARFFVAKNRAIKRGLEQKNRAIKKIVLCVSWHLLCKVAMLLPYFLCGRCYANPVYMLQLRCSRC